MCIFVISKIFHFKKKCQKNKIEYLFYTLRNNYTLHDNYTNDEFQEKR